MIETTAETCGGFHRQYPRYRPRLIERWPRLKAEERQQIQRFGTYKLAASAKPHLSVAQVSEIYVADAFKLARKLVTLPQGFGVESIQLVDVGHGNERWEVLQEWSKAKRSNQ